MKRNCLVFNLNRPALVGYASEALAQQQTVKPLGPVGMQTLIYSDSGCLYVQIYDDAGRLDGYARVPGLRRDQVEATRPGHRGGKRGDDAQFAIMAIRGGEPVLEMGPWDAVAGAICAPEFAETRVALAQHPLERYRVAEFMQDVVKFGAHATSPAIGFFVADHVPELDAWSKERKACAKAYPHFRQPKGHTSILAAPMPAPDVIGRN